MAQFSNLPSRLFHVLFGQPPKEWSKKKKKKKERKDRGEKRLNNTRRHKEHCEQKLSHL